MAYRLLLFEPAPIYSWSPRPPAVSSSLCARRRYPPPRAHAHRRSPPRGRAHRRSFSSSARVIRRSSPRPRARPRAMPNRGSSSSGLATIAIGGAPTRAPSAAQAPHPPELLLSPVPPELLLSRQQDHDVTRASPFSAVGAGEKGTVGAHIGAPSPPATRSRRHPSSSSTAVGAHERGI
jgi:hypothetical protein